MNNDGKIEDDVTFLIKCVKSRPILYDKSDEDYSNVVLRDKTWMDIAEETLASDLECKRKWNYLRGKFARECLNHDGSTATTAADHLNGSSKQSTWPYLKYMMFLKGHCRKRTKIIQTSKIRSDEAIAQSTDIAEPIQHIQYPETDQEHQHTEIIESSDIPDHLTDIYNYRNQTATEVVITEESIINNDMLNDVNDGKRDNANDEQLNDETIIMEHHHNEHQYSNPMPQYRTPSTTNECEKEDEPDHEHEVHHQEHIEHNDDIGQQHHNENFVFNEEHEDINHYEEIDECPPRKKIKLNLEFQEIVEDTVLNVITAVKDIVDRRVQHCSSTSRPQSTIEFLRVPPTELINSAGERQTITTHASAVQTENITSSATTTCLMLDHFSRFVASSLKDLSAKRRNDAIAYITSYIAKERSKENL